MADSGVRKRSDPHLEERLARYDGWVREGRIPFSSRVVPVGESLSAEQWVLPPAQALEVLRKARTFALTDCACRTRYRRCDHPTDVCFLLDAAADAAVAEGRARRVSLEEAAGVLRRANEQGLVHLTIYDPQQGAFALCNCCPCCCHDLQFLRLYGRGDLIARSDYAAATDPEACTHCGDCIERCVFGARTERDGQMRYDPGACYGCGLCVTVCQAGATVMRRR